MSFAGKIGTVFPMREKLPTTNKDRNCTGVQFFPPATCTVVQAFKRKHAGMPLGEIFSSIFQIVTDLSLARNTRPQRSDLTTVHRKIRRIWEPVPVNHGTGTVPFGVAGMYERYRVSGRRFTHIHRLDDENNCGYRAVSHAIYQAGSWPSCGVKLAGKYTHASRVLVFLFSGGRV
jgi:hypothetical protein